ncbi:hypothetical protein [Kitasatospora cinereorecta]|uniref:hypothetical protein n=1 Tax=Kitasatospora cinereorecta TaxID=285560 RepID=UPI0031F7CC58
MDLVQAVADQPVPDLVIPFDDLAGVGAECEPVPGLRGHFLTKKYQEVIGGKMSPCTRDRG